MEYGLTERRTERKASKFTKSTYKYALALKNTGLQKGIVLLNVQDLP